jgi:hypothetical protein
MAKVKALQKQVTSMRRRVREQTENVVEHASALGVAFGYGYGVAAGVVPARIANVDTELAAGALAAVVGMSRVRYANLFRASGLALLGSWATGYGASVAARGRGAGAAAAE